MWILFVERRFWYRYFWFYFALPGIIGHRVDPYFAAISACSINSGAYIAEIFRAGIQSIDKGQMEAGRSLGMSWAQTMRYVIMPQALNALFHLWATSYCNVEGFFVGFCYWV